MRIDRNMTRKAEVAMRAAGEVMTLSSAATKTTKTP